MPSQRLQIIVFVSVLVCGCGSTSNSLVSPSSVSLNSPTFPTPTVAQIQGIYAQFANGVQITVGGQSVTLRPNGIPEYPSPYFGAGHPLYETPHDGMNINPNIIAEQSRVFLIPKRFEPMAGSAIPRV